MLLRCRWISIIEMFEVSRGGAPGMFRSCHQTKPMVTSSSSMFSNRITCLDEPFGEEKQKHANLQERVQLTDRYSTGEASDSAFTQLKVKRAADKVTGKMQMQLCSGQREPRGVHRQQLEYSRDV